MSCGLWVVNIQILNIQILKHHNIVLSCRLRGTSLEGGAGQHLGEILAILPKLEWVE